MTLRSLCLVFIVLISVTASFVAVSAQTSASQYDREIRTIAENEKMRAAFQYIEDMIPRSLSDLILLTEIPAPPFKEDARGAKFAEMLKEAGADEVRIDEVGNVIALRRGTSGGRVVALEGHLDTVFPEGTDVTVKMRGDTLFAPGIGDDTRGLIVVLSVLRAMESAQIETESDILFIGTVGEEGLGDLRGVKHLFRDDGPRIDSWIAVDGGGIQGIVHRGLGSHRYRVTFKGPGGHSWGAFGLVNPHHALGMAIENFVLAADMFTAQGERTSYSVGRIGGGTSINAIPFESWMEVDMRSVSPERLNGIDALFQEAVAAALKEQNDLRRSGPELTVEIEMVGNRPSGATDIEAPIVQRAAAATRFFNVEPSFGISSTNSNTPIAKGIPAITIGRGGIGGGGHALNEWWVNKDGYLAIQRALLITAAEAGMAK